MKHWVPAVPLGAILLGAGLCACSSTPAPELRAGELRSRAAPERYIVAAVDNDAAVPGGRAGSTPRAYDALSAYGPSARALRVIQEVETEYRLREVSAWPIKALHLHCAVLEIPASADRESVLAAMAKDKRLKLAQPLQTFATQTAMYNDPYVGLQNGFQQMDVSGAHAWSRGEGVKIAVIDTGADFEHPDLRGVISRYANFVDDDALQFRRDRHGTEIAGVIAAVANNGQGIVGVAPGSRLLIFKACWQMREGEDAARCNTFTLAKALAAALEARVQIVNLSLAGPQDPLLRDLITEGMRRGIVFVGAAPSTGGEEHGRFLQQSGVIDVATMGSDKSLGTPLFAPGREILTLLPNDHYDFVSGSSLATAHVTGAVALLLAMDSQLSGTAARRLLQDTTQHAVTVSGAADSVDACAAVVALVGHGQCRHAPGGSGNP